MDILNQALNKINTKNKQQRDFFIVLISGLIGAAGKKTFRNLSRYMQMNEHTFSRQMAKVFDFVGLNIEIIKTNKSDDEVIIAAQDASFLKKSGKLTHGLDFFWNGCAAKAERGLELDVIAAIKINGEKKDGYTISAQQTPSNPLPKEKRKMKKMTDPTRIDHYLSHLKSVISKVFELGVKYIVVDAFFAKSKYVNGVIELGLHVISKLRKDARLCRIYNGPQKARGRKKKFDTGRVNSKDFIDSVITKIGSEEIELRSCIAYSVSLSRSIKVVLVSKMIGNKCGEALLFSTDLEMDTLQIYQYYVARFQIEFIFRDAKGFTGLTDCQSRDPRRLHYHFNASLAALNVAKLQDQILQKKQHVQHAFSMTNWSRKYHLEIVINRFIDMFGFDQTLIKSHPNFQHMMEFGNVNH